MVRVLLTGAGGFIGAHTLEHILAETDWEVVCLDSFRHKGLTDRITDSLGYQFNPGRVRVFTHDLIAPLSPLLIDRIGSIDYVINMASESHVNRSIQHPVPFVQNNVSLVLNMLEYAREVRPKAFIQIGTDEVYGPVTQDHRHVEWSPILPSNPYAASKAAQEAIAVSYWRSYGVPVILTNTMNNFGERQDAEKYLPMVIRSVLDGRVVTVHASKGEIGSRYWLHARNHADALVWLLQHTTPGKYPERKRPDRYNVVGDRRMNNMELASHVARILDRPLYHEVSDYHSSRPGHDLHYGLDGSRLASLGWNPPVEFEQALERTVQWTARHPEWLQDTHTLAEVA
jgi:dTDP-glucose 4,6-dehydratase